MIDPEKPDYADTPVAPTRPIFGYRPAETSPAPVVSVITPFYNTGEVFLETAKSLLGQSFQDIEWTIVDDGSTDESALQRLRQVVASDARIKLVTQSNAGPAAARNAAVRSSLGRYLFLFDSDDLIEPTMIEKCVWFLESNPQFGFCNAWSVSFGDQTFLWSIGFERGKAHLEANSGPAIAVVRRGAFEAAGGFDESIRLGHEDWDFWLALAKAGYWGHTLPEYLSWYRKRASGRFRQVMGAPSVHREFEALIARKYAGLQAKFPSPVIKPQARYETLPSDLPIANRLRKSKSTLRLLYVVPWMVTGGADKVNLDWIAALTRNGYQVSICATLASYHNWLPEFAKLTPDIFVLSNFLRPADYPRFLRYLIASRDIDIVLLSNSTFGYMVLPYLRAHFPAVTFVDLSHVEEPHWMNGGHPRFGVGYQDMLDLNLVTTSDLRDWMVANGAEAERIEVCRSGIDTAQLDLAAADAVKARSTLQLKDDTPVIVFAGRICAQKRPLFLAEILRTLAKRGVTFQVLIVGDGELRAALASKLNAAGLTASVSMLGTVGHDEWLQALAAADVFLLPSQYEGISIALLEAMGMGVVPVTAEVGGQAEAVAPDCGILVPHGDRELDDYVNALERLLTNPALRVAMGDAAKLRIRQKFSLPVTTSNLLAGLNRARHLTTSQPRLAVARGYAQEVATLGVEYLRMSALADHLWGQVTGSSLDASTGLRLRVVKQIRQTFMLMSASPIGALLRRNPRVHTWGKRLMARVKKL